MMEKFILGLLILSLLKINDAISLGHMYPNGKIIRMQGETIEINCTLDGHSGYTINDLNFEINQKNVTHETIEINPKTKMFRIKNAPKMNANVDCILNKTGIDRVTIDVGTKPEKVIDFQCKSYNWENLTCSFEKPSNPATVNYTLYYDIGYDKRTFLTTPYVCNLKPNFNRIYTCSIGFSNEPPYRQSYDNYFFRLIGDNPLGNLTEDFTIYHYNIMVPNPPENIKSANITSNSAVLTWDIPAILQTFPKQFVYMITYTTEFDNKSWTQLGPFIEPSRNERERSIHMSHTLTNLPYASVAYDCRVYLKVKDAEDTADMWSNFNYYVFETASRIPNRPPLTNIGSFSFTDSGHVFIYWKELMKFEHSGKNLKYVVIGANNTNLTSTRTLAKLEQIDANIMTEPFTFYIYSQNDAGRSINYSIVRVPPVEDRCKPPTLIKKIRLDNQTYNISWVAPIWGPEIISYTIFWCEPSNESPNDCKGSIDFETISSDVLSYRFETNNSMNFAISANSQTSSSGMIWAMCTVLPGNEINKLTSIITVRVQSTSIEYKWSLACIDRTILSGYILEYCPIKDPKTEECKEHPRSHNISATAKEYKLDGLKPYTLYAVRIRMLSDNSEGPWSESQVNVTLEAAPTPPLNLRHHNITNTSVYLTWDTPETVNGVVVRYEVSCNGQTYTAEKTQGTATDPYLLAGLQSFTEYEVVVKACTVVCSDSSNPIIFNTSIGYPGEIQQPKVSNWQRLQWEPPAVAGGRLEYYEVLVVYTNNGKQERTIQINGTKCHFTREFHDMTMGNGQFDYSVRGVNVLHSSHYKGHFVNTNNINNNNNKTKRDLAQKYIDVESDHSKSESNLLKRHSKAEIDAESKGYNLNHKIESTIHKPLSTNEHEISDGAYKHHAVQTNSEDLNRIKICKEEDDEQLDSYLKADKWPTLFKGPYSVSYTHQTNARSNSNRYLYMIVFLIIFTMAFVYGAFFALKKLKRMKDISVELPEGLEDIKEESKAKHLDGGITRDELGRTLDYRTNNEQENDPLVRFRMESSASTSGSESNSQSEYNEGMDNSIGYEQNTEEDSVRSGSETMNNTQHKKSPPTPLIPMQQSEMREIGIIQNPTPPSPLLQMSPETHSLHDSQHNNRANHFTPRQMPALTSTGYVTHEAIIGKPAVSSGYTPWSAVDAATKRSAEQTNPTHTDEMKAKTPIITSTDLHGISGYVTHKQLSDFGQLMH